MLKFYCLFYLKPDIYLAKYLRDFLIMTKFYFKNNAVNMSSLNTNINQM